MGARFFSEFPRVSAWGSGSEKVSYECREPTKFQGEIHQPLKHIADDLEHLRSQQTSIKGVRSASIVERVLQ